MRSDGQRRRAAQLWQISIFPRPLCSIGVLHTFAVDVDWLRFVANEFIVFCTKRSTKHECTNFDRGADKSLTYFLFYTLTRAEFANGSIYCFVYHGAVFEQQIFSAT